MTVMALLIFAGALIARVLSRGVRGVLPFLIAIWLGDTNARRGA